MRKPHDLSPEDVKEELSRIRDRLDAGHAKAAGVLSRQLRDEGEPEDLDRESPADDDASDSSKRP